MSISYQVEEIVKLSCTACSQNCTLAHGRHSYCSPSVHPCIFHQSPTRCAGAKLVSPLMDSSRHAGDEVLSCPVAMQLCWSIVQKKKSSRSLLSGTSHLSWSAVLAWWYL